MMAANLPREGEWVQGTALEAVIPQVKTLGKLVWHSARNIHVHNFQAFLTTK